MIKKDSAVSPVVGVLLMLVVTIIIAAVVSGFAGSLVSGTQKAPSLVMDMGFVNTGLGYTTYTDFKVKEVSEPIPTKDLKLITSWKTKTGISGGANVTGPRSQSADLNTHTHSLNSTKEYHSPIGFGGMINWSSTAPYNYEQWWGNYSLTSGVYVRNYPSGSPSGGGYGYLGSLYTYNAGSSFVAGDIDAVNATLGSGWENLREGDIIDVSIMHIPSGKIIVDQKVVVKGQ